MPKTMRVAVAHDFNDIRIEERPVPQIGPREALVKIAVCGISSGDVMPWYIRKKTPIVLGHEPAGTVEEVGAEVTCVKPGDRVAIHHHAPCFVCRFCRRGDHVQCATWKRTHIDPGGVAEYVRVPEENLVGATLVLPPNVTMEDATLVESVACGVKGFKRARIRPGDMVLVLGLGAMGQLNIVLARHYGAKVVIAADFQGFRCDYARKLGADLVINMTKRDLAEEVRKATDGLMADIVVVDASSVQAVESGIRCCGRGGTVLLSTPIPREEKLTIPLHDLYFSEISLVSAYLCGPFDTREALELIEQRVVTARRIVTHRFPLEKTGEAFRKTAEAGDSIKSLVIL